MFVQVIQGQAKHPVALRRQWRRRNQQLKPAANGCPGSTAGVTANG